MLFGKGPAALRVNFLLVIWQVRLVGDEDLLHVRLGVRLYLFEPVLNVIESHFFCAVVDEEDAHRTLIIRLCDRSESFLTGSIPHLKFHVLVHDVYCFYSEVDADGGHVARGKLVIGETKKQAGLAD